MNYILISAIPVVEEEIKKLRHELALDGAYSQVAFSYDQVDNSCPSLSEGDDEKYSVPEKLTLPVGLNLVSETTIKHAP